MKWYRTAALVLLLAGATLVLHVSLSISLFSVVVAPFVLATWLSYQRSPAGWLLVVLAIISELTAGTVPGIMAVAIIIPAGAHLLFPSVHVSFTFSFFALLVAVTALQFSIGIFASAYATGFWDFPVPAILSVLGSAMWAFLVCVVWYEVSDRLAIR